MSYSNGQHSDKKIIAVAAPIGRVGSSALMGLLNLTGINLGGRKTGLSGKAPMAPKGFFELPGLKKIHPAYFISGLPPPPTITEYKNFSKLYTSSFVKLITMEFGNQFPIAIKSLRLFIIPMLHNLRYQYNIYIIRLSRELYAQAASLANVFKQSRRQITIDKCKQYILQWKVFEKQVWDMYSDFTFIDITFEKLINRPIQTMQQLGNILNITVPGNTAIQAWIDPQLVHKERT